MRGRQSKRLRHLAKMQVGKMLVESGKEITAETIAEANLALKRVHRLLKQAWQTQSNPKSLLYVDLALPSRSRLHERLISSGVIRRT